MSEPIYIGLGTPQANPTVEVEFRRLWRAPVQPMVTRLTSSADTPGQRLIEYLEQLPDAIASFDTLPLRAFAFACTGSAYLAGAEREEQITETAEQRFRIQVVTATQAIRRELQGRGARRMAMLAPYPKELCTAAADYWHAFGVDVVALERIDVGPDTRGIYALTDSVVAQALDAFDPRDADLLLLSGTGMPTISALSRPGIPILSSSLCLATEMLRRTQQYPAGEAANIDVLLGKTNA